MSLLALGPPWRTRACCVHTRVNVSEILAEVLARVPTRHAGVRAPLLAWWVLRLSSVRMERAGKVLAKLKLSDAISADQLAFAAWPAAVGERIAVHAAPKALVRGSLVVEVEDGIWQKQLFHLRFDILAKLTEVLGSGIITDLEFRIATATPRRPPQSAQSHSKTVPADDADSIQDPVMRIIYKQARSRYKQARSRAKKASA